MDKKVWVVIAAYNESKHIAEVLKETKRFCKNIVVIDDGSKDNTYQISKNSEIFALKHIVNMGKGAAIKTGCDFALKQGADVLILVDADGQHEPKEIPNFLNALEDKDIVFGYRTFSKKMPIILKFGNIFINKTTKFLYGIDLKDTQCGYRAMTSKAYKKVKWLASDYSMESEMIANAGNHRLKHAELPIKTIYADKYKGTTFLDGIKIVRNLLWWKLRKLF